MRKPGHRQHTLQPGSKLVDMPIIRTATAPPAPSLRPSRIGPRSMSITSPGQSSDGNVGQSFKRPSVTSNNRCCSAGKRFCRAASQRPASPSAASNGVPPPAPSPSSQWRKPLDAFNPCTCHFGSLTAGGQQRQARALAVGIVEQLRQQALGIAQAPDGDGSRPRHRRSPATVHGANGCAGGTADPRADAAGHSASVPGQLIEPLRAA